MRNLRDWNPPLGSNAAWASRLLALGLLTTLIPHSGAAEEWYRIESADGRATVLFPNPAEDPRELVQKIPGGKVVTQVAEHQSEGLLMTISASTMPRFAVKFAGPAIIFKNAKQSLLSEAYAEELSSETIDIPGADAAMVLRYEAPDLHSDEQAGFSGLAVFAIVDKTIYTINSAISQKTGDNEAMQQKLLGSFEIHSK